MAPGATRLLAALLIAGKAAASGLAQASPSDQCVALLHSLAGHDDLELAALCRAQLPQEQCRLAKSVLRSQPWSPEKVNLACAKWDERTRLLQSQGVDFDGTVRAKAAAPGAQPVDVPARARTLEDGVVGEAEMTPDAVVQSKLVYVPGTPHEELTTTTAKVTTTNTDEDRFWRQARNLLRNEGGRSGIDRFPGGEAVLNDMGLESEQEPEEKHKQEQSHKEAAREVAAAATEQKWAKTLGLKHALVSGAAWPFSVLLAFVLMGVVAPLLRTRLALGRDNARVTAFTPLVQIHDQGKPVSPQSIIEA